MSFDIHLQSFADDSDKSELVEALLDSRLDESRQRISTGDGDAEVYSIGRRPLTSVMFTHVAGQEAWDVIYDVAVAANWVILPGTDVFVVDEAQIATIPESLLDYLRESNRAVRLIHSGQELLQAVVAS